MTAAIERRRKKHIEIILFLCKIHFIPKNFRIYTTYVGAILCMFFYILHTYMWVCILLLVTILRNPFSRCNNTILFSCMGNIRIEMYIKSRNKNDRGARARQCHRSVYILEHTQTSRRTTSFLSLSSLLAYSTLVLLPFIHFTFMIRIKHIRFIWRVHLQHQEKEEEEKNSEKKIWNERVYDSS